MAATHHELPIICDILRVRRVGESARILDVVNKELAAAHILNEWEQIVVDVDIVFSRWKTSEST